MIEGIPLLGIGQGALLSFVILCILTDRLIWHKRLDVVVAQLKAEQDRNAELTRQNTMLLDSAIPTVNHVLTALHMAARDDDG